jgi:hypothetical protein
VPTSLTLGSKLWSGKCDGGLGCALPLSKLAAEGSHIARLVAPYAANACRLYCVMGVLEGRARAADLVAAARGDPSQAAFGRASLRSLGQLVAEPV